MVLPILFNFKKHFFPFSKDLCHRDVTVSDFYLTLTVFRRMFKEIRLGTLIIEIINFFQVAAKL